MNLASNHTSHISSQSLNLRKRKNRYVNCCITFAFFHVLNVLCSKCAAIFIITGNLSRFLEAGRPGADMMSDEEALRVAKEDVSKITEAALMPDNASVTCRRRSRGESARRSIQQIFHMKLLYAFTVA